MRERQSTRVYPGISDLMTLIGRIVHQPSEGAYNARRWRCPVVKLGSPYLRGVSISFLAVVTIAACSGAAVPPTAPTPQAVTPQVSPQLPSRTITGSVWVHSQTASQPLAGISVGIWIEQPRSGGPAGSVRTNSEGRFSFQTPADALVRLYTGTDELYQPCLSTVRVDQTEATIRLVAESELLQARDWPDFAVERMLSGTIFEASPTGRLSVADAWVQVDGVYGDGRPLADTRSDANGRFVVCGLEGNPIHALVVAKPGYHLAFPGLPTQGSGPLDVELRVCTAGHARLPGGWCH